MAYLLDTNVISELRKGARCSQSVAKWARATADEGHFVSVITLGEIRKEIEVLRRRSPSDAHALESWLARVESAYAEVFLPVNEAVAQRWGRLNAERTLPVIDGLLAATALEHRLTLVTRNTADFPQSVPLVNPFET